MIFISNKYATWYYSIISSSKTRILSEDIYTERHHIIPKSLGGGNEKSNIAILTAREHFICHILLTKMTTGNHRYRMVYAAKMMSIMESKNQKRYINARLHETIKIEYSKILRRKKNTEETRRKISIAKKGKYTGKDHPFYRKKHTEEARRKMSNSRKEKCIGKDNGMYGKKHTKETRRKMSESGKNRLPITEETRRKMSTAKKGKYTGKNSSMYGKKHTEETLEKIRGRVHTKEERRKMSESGKKRKKILCCGKWYDPGNLTKHRKTKHSN